MRIRSAIWICLCVGCGGGAADEGAAEPADTTGDEVQEVDSSDDTGPQPEGGPECGGCVASMGGCLRPGPQPEGEGAHPTQNIPCDSSCCGDENSYAEGLRAICACPAEIEASREPDWQPSDIAIALGRCVSERGRNARVTALVESFPEGQRAERLGTALDEASVPREECALLDVWSD